MNAYIDLVSLQKCSGWRSQNNNTPSGAGTVKFLGPQGLKGIPGESLTFPPRCRNRHKRSPRYRKKKKILRFR